MQRELDATAEAGPVDRGDGRIWQRTDASEELVACLAALARKLRGGVERELIEVGSGREEVGLARDHEAAPLSASELAEDRPERLERGPAEDGRLRVVGAVVDRHQRKRPLELGPPYLCELELGQRVKHAPTATPPPSPSRRREPSGQSCRSGVRPSRMRAARRAARPSPQA